MKPIEKWLATQPKEFVENVLNNTNVRFGILTVEELRELDDKFNPEDENE